MNVQLGPNSHDEPDLLYKLQRKIKVFDTNDPFPNRGYNLVASASKYGAVFIGIPAKKLAVYHLNELIDKECEPSHLLVPLQEKPTHIVVNCDQELLAVTGGHLFVLFQVVNLLNQNVSPLLSVRFDVNPSTFVSDVKWNPCIPDTIAYAFYDGAIVICQAGQGPVKKLQSSARCLCWSPKGKQLVVGNNDGTICQYKPDLSPMKSFPAPDLFQGAPVEVLAIYWISTFQFAVVYRNAADNSKPAVTIVNTPKGGQPSCLNYEDICYSTASSRPWYYYLQGLAQWNVILCSSSNSMEIATLGSTDGSNWLQWYQSDEARPELPLTAKKQENYPIGISIDTAAVHQLPWGENEKLPFMPTLHVLSQTGLLTIFNVINLNKAAPQIYTPVTIVSTTPFPAQSQPVSVAPPVAAAPPIAAAPPTAAAPQPIPEQPVLAHQQVPVDPTPTPFSLSKTQFGRAPAQQQAPEVQATKPVEAQPKPPMATSAPPAQAQPNPVPVQTDHTQEIYAALKAEQDLAVELANMELRSMLNKEANEFQTELYDFVVKTRNAQRMIYLELNAINKNAEIQNLDAETLKKDCSLDELRSAIIALKLDLVRACSVVAEARTHSDAKDLDQWTQADPLTAKRVASVKKLAYYVQTQVEQAHRALDYKWNQIAERDMKSNKPGSRMIRPIMDDVYQPLVKQQEILSRQEAVLKMLKNTLRECDGTPVYKSTNILRSTPFKKDQLSKLTKNILNMSLEPQKNENKNFLTAQKLDALRDMLSNHKTVRIKPVNVEIKHHMTAMRMKYEQSIKEKAIEPPVKFKVKQPVKPTTEVTFTPIVVEPVPQNPNTRWFTEEPPKEARQEPQAQQTQPSNQQISFSISTPVQANLRANLKDQLQNKQVTVELKKDDNTVDFSSFMGQKICSPSNLNFSSVIVATPTSFTTKPISSLNHMLNQFAPQVSKQEPNPSATGEPDSNVTEEKQMSNLFKMATSTPLKLNFQNVPDVLSSSSMITIKRVEPKAVATPDKSKENVTGKSEKVILTVPKVNKEEKKENEPKPFSVQNTNKPLFGSIAQPVATSSAASVKPGDAQKSIETKAKLETEAPKVTSKSTIPTASSASIFATANATITVPKPKSIFGSTAVTSTTATAPFESIPISKAGATGSSIFATPASISPVTAKTEAASIFSSANSSITSKPQSSSIFSSTATPTSVFGTSPTSVFGTATTTQTSVALTPSVSAAKAAESTSNSAASTPSSVIESTAKSVFSSAASTTPTTSASAAAAESTVSTPSTVGTSTISTQAATTTQSVFSSTTATTQSVPSTTSSIFGSVTSTTQPSVFGGTPTSATSVFGTSSATPSSVFGSTSAKPNSVFGTSTTTQAPVTGSATTPPTSTFGSPTTTQAPALGSGVTTQASVFGTTTTPTSVFGSAETQSPVLESITTAPSSVFGSAVTTSASVFGGTATTATSVFGTVATTKASAFGSPTTPTAGFGGTATTQASVFGTTETTQASVFGSTSANQTSVFGSPATTQASVFAATTQASVFGSSATSPASVFGIPATSASVFGSTATTQASVFGSSQTPSVFGSPQTTQASVFGGQASPSVFGSPTSQASVFGSPASPASVFGSAQTQASIFGTPTQSTQASVFGTPTTTAASVFGSPGQSVFGTPATTTQSGSIFGGGDSLFSSVSISTTSASQGGGNIFGGGSTGTSGFGSSSNVFGGKSTFGQPNPTAEAIFGGGGGGGGGFGQTSPPSNFWGTNNNSSGGFGSSGFGQQATTQSSVFGTGSFSAPAQPGQAFGSPTSSTGGFGSGFGGKAVFGQPSGFGSPTSSGFGAPAAFGGFNKSPGGFGASATFGGTPGFGGSTFGNTSPGPVFGGGAPASGFGSPTQSNATFESLATQNTLTFGNLAQQTPQPAQPAPSFNTSPSFTGWRG